MERRWGGSHVETVLEMYLKDIASVQDTKRNIFPRSKKIFLLPPSPSKADAIGSNGKLANSMRFSEKNVPVHKLLITFKKFSVPLE